MVAAQSATRPAGWGTRQVVRWSHLIGLALIVAAAFFIFKD